MINIVNSALQIRKAAEKIAPALGYDSLSLKGMCALVSAALIEVIPDSEFVGGKFDDNGHCWVIHEEKFVDVTATQFGLSNIIIIGSWEPLRSRYQILIRGKYALDIAKMHQPRLFNLVSDNWWKL